MSVATISIVTPCYNEEGNVARCAEEVARVMRETLPGYDYEHIFSDNSSTDRTVAVLKEIAARDSRVKVLVNSRNVGPFRNIAHGMRNSSGDFIVPMVPADIQDPPSAIPDLVAKMTPEIDVVYGVRKKRPDTLLMKLARNTYYFALKLSGGATPPAHSGEFMLVRRDLSDAILQANNSYPYIRGLIAQTNPRFDTVEYEWGVRTIGKSRNSIPDLVDQALNGLVSTARAPIRWALLLGILGSIIGITIAIVNLVLFLAAGAQAAPGIPTLIVATFLFGGINLFFLGLVGEYVLSIHAAVRPDPPFFDRERINFGQEDDRNESSQ